jgi:hypothetical protein
LPDVVPRYNGQSAEPLGSRAQRRMSLCDGRERDRDLLGVPFHLDWLPPGALIRLTPPRLNGTPSGNTPAGQMGSARFRQRAPAATTPATMTAQHSVDRQRKHSLCRVSPDAWFWLVRAAGRGLGRINSQALYQLSYRGTTKSYCSFLELPIRARPACARGPTRPIRRDPRLFTSRLLTL